MRDQLGRDIPEHLHVVFDQREWMDDLALELRIVQHEVHRDAEECPEAWSYFDMVEFDGLMKNMIGALASGKPYAACPVCRGTDANCRLYHGRGFLTKPGIKQAQKYGLWPGVSDV